VISAASLSSCQGPRLVLDGRAIASGGGYAITFTPLRAASVNQTRGRRPWVASQ
jgi:hypothetical protein